MSFQAGCGFITFGSQIVVLQEFCRPALSLFLLFRQTTRRFHPSSSQFLHQSGLISFSNGSFSYVAANYDTLVNGVLEANNLIGYTNGWFVVPVLAGAALFFQQRITAKQNPQMQQQQQQMAMMNWMMPIFSVWICTTSNTAFALYWTVSNLYAFAQNFAITAIERAKEKRNAPKVIKEGEAS